MSVKPETAGGTRCALIEAALVLFAEKGFELVTIRDITGKAGANVASVKYHFGSRENLIDEVVARLVTPVNEERIRRLGILEAGGESPDVRQLLEALFEPLLSQIKESPVSEKLFCKLMGRIVGERPYEFTEVIMSQFRELAEQFTPKFMAAVPGLTREDALWQVHFSFGALSSTLMHGELLKQISAGTIGEENLETTFTRIIDFCEAGFSK
ncbi:TetR/AcrR family transcriptional regulator [Verrucomicrobiaceae bacterium 227]